jgi:hypothetical protein
MGQAQKRLIDDYLSLGVIQKVLCLRVAFKQHFSDKVLEAILQNEK